VITEEERSELSETFNLRKRPVPRSGAKLIISSPAEKHSGPEIFAMMFRLKKGPFAKSDS
jgi:hypothetical protein